MQEILPKRYYWNVLPSVPLSYLQMQLTKKVRKEMDSGQFRFEPLQCLCGNFGETVLATRDRFNIPSRTVVCDECGLIRTDPRMSDSTLTRFYTEFYQPLYEGEESFESLFENQKKHGKLIAKYTSFDSKKEATVFELGPGPGGILSVFKDLGHEVLGAELNKNAARWAKEHADINILAGDIEVLKKSNKKADLVILSHVLEHLPEPLNILEEVAGLLTSDGMLYVEVPGVRSLMTGETGICGHDEKFLHNKDFLEYLRSVHLWSFELRTLTALLSTCGFKLVKGDELVRASFRLEKKPEHKVQWGRGRGSEIISFIQKLEIARQDYDRENRTGDLKRWARTFASWTKHHYLKMRSKGKA